MGYSDAIDDGIKIVGTGRPTYYIPCEKCGELIRRTQYSRKRTYICDYCKGILKKKEKIAFETMEVQTKKEKQFEKAIAKIKNQVEQFECYKKPIEIARTRAEMYGSIPEAMVAIELIRLGYKIIPQQKINKYKVDFAIPKEKIVVEVDGEIYHKNVFKGNREAEIQLSLGLNWKIIHIPAEKIAVDIQKLEKVIYIFKNS